jgi:hypothetical protein
MTTITFDSEFPGGIDMADAFVKVELDTGGLGPGWYSGGEIVGVHKFHLNADGEGSIDLVGNDVIDPEGSVWRIDVEGYKVALSVPNTGGPYSWADPDLITTENPPVVLVPGADTNVSPYIDPAVDFDAANDGVTDDSAPLQAAIDEAVSSGRPIVLVGEYLHAVTLEWDATGPLVVYADAATVTYSGSGWAWDMDMDSGASGLPTVLISGGTFVGGASADGCFYMHDMRRATFNGVKVEGFTNGPAWCVENEGRWSERNSWESCESVDNRQALLFDLVERTPTSKTIASSVATLTVGAHPWIVGDRLVVELDPADADYDSTNATVTAITGTTISYATAGANEGATATTGVVRSKGSFARTKIRNLELTGGTADVPHIEFHQNAGPYDSLIDGVHGNIAEDSIVLKMAGGAMGGTTVGRIGVERQSTGTVYAIALPDDTATGQRPTYITNLRTTSDPDSGGEGVETYYGTDPDESPFLPQTIYGGIDTDAYIEALLGIILRISATHPVLGDWPTNPAVGTLLLRDDDGGADGVYGLVVRTNNGFRTAPLNPSGVTTYWDSDPSTLTGTFVAGDICIDPSPAPGNPERWRCTTGGVDAAAVWKVAATLAP